MFRTHIRARKNEVDIRLLSKTLQDEALQVDVARSAILEKAASELENIAHRIYLSSPDELLSRGMKEALKRGEDFETVFKRKLLNAFKTDKRQGDIITELTTKANKIISNTRVAQSAKVNRVYKLASAEKTRLPQLKGALGRENLEKQLGDLLWKKGYPKEVVANVQSSMMHADVGELHDMIQKLGKGGK